MRTIQQFILISKKFCLITEKIAFNKELDEVYAWVKLNKLTLNAEKTKCMFFRKKKTLPKKYICA